MYADARGSGLHLSQLPLRADGGASSNQLLMQMQADVLDRAVVRSTDIEATALGAALAVGVTLELWTPEDLFLLAHADDGKGVQYLPAITHEECAARYERWQRGISRSVGWMQPYPGENVHEDELDPADGGGAVLLSQTEP